ncbi:MAG: hypothetical protein ABI743_11580, partial [bacterium]
MRPAPPYFLLITSLLLLTLAAPAVAEGQATGKRTHKPLRFRAYVDTAASLEGETFLLSDLVALVTPIGLFF